MPMPSPALTNRDRISKLESDTGLCKSSQGGAAGREQLHFLPAGSRRILAGHSLACAPTHGPASCTQRCQAGVWLSSWQRENQNQRSQVTRRPRDHVPSEPLLHLYPVSPAGDEHGVKGSQAREHQRMESESGMDGCMASTYRNAAQPPPTGKDGAWCPRNAPFQKIPAGSRTRGRRGLPLSSWSLLAPLTELCPWHTAGLRG